MKIAIKLTSVLLFAVTMTLAVGCTKQNDNNNSGGGSSGSDVVVTTYTPADVSSSTAVCGGSVQVVQGLTLTKIGVCWSTSANPTASDYQLSSEAWNEPFIRTVSGLSPNTTYHVRAFALRGLDYYYGEDKTFTTLVDNGGGGGGGNGGGDTPTIPSVMTTQVTNITQNTAQGGGNVTNDEGSTIMERGICWGVSHDPTINGSHGSDGNGTGSFSVTMENLTAGKTYYVRAYAVNSQGIGYGNEVSFTTLSGGGGTTPEAPTGAIRGLFSVSPTKQVWFSKGNLQYQATTNTWRFAESQWDYVGTRHKDAHNFSGGTVNGSDNYNISSSYSGWIDLFGWGTSGWNCGSTYYHPWDSDFDHPGDGELYGPFGSALTGSYANSDWGVYNPISNGGNQAGLWRTLTKDEWLYLLNTRNTLSGIRFATARVNNVYGIILLPDNWNPSVYTVQNANCIVDLSLSLFTKNIFTVSEWSILEQQGVVFFPTAGSRTRSEYHGIQVGAVNNNGYMVGNAHYWSSSDGGDYFSCAYFIDLFGQKDHMSRRWIGNSVRLVQDYQ